MEKQKGNMFSTNDFSGLVLLLGFGRDDFVSAGGGCRVVAWAWVSHLLFFGPSGLADERNQYNVN